LFWANFCFFLFFVVGKVRFLERHNFFKVGFFSAAAARSCEKLPDVGQTARVAQAVGHFF
jgi:hypothetical protein